MSGSDIVAIILGAVALIVSIIALYISCKSEEKMKAMASLNFHEKRAMMNQYERYFADNRIDVSTELDRFEADLEALTYVAK